MPPRVSQGYHVGIVCALGVEYAAVIAMLDDEHPSLPSEERGWADTNTYTLGRMGVHNVVIACLPAGTIGIGAAATIASKMQGTFQIIFGLMVGVGGGVATVENDIRLGDVVVSVPHETHPGVVQWDLGRTGAGGRSERTGSLDRPPPILLGAVQQMQTNHYRRDNEISRHHQKMLQDFEKMRDVYKFPGRKVDKLFSEDYDHEGPEGDCNSCQEEKTIIRLSDRIESKIHYGTIASGSQVIKNSKRRIELSQDLGAICIEMEAAGLMNDFKCLVIRGICDYADSHKNWAWQAYAAATAAAVAKEILGCISKQSIDQIKSPSAHFLVSHTQNPNFVPRHKLLEMLEPHLNPKKYKGHTRIALTGLGGCGKTELALHYVYTWQGHHNVFWIDGTSSQRFMSEYSQIAFAEGLTSEGTKATEDSCIKTRDRLDSEEFGNWRMVIDNVDDLTELEELLHHMLPRKTGIILFTSRDRRITGSRLVPQGFEVNVNMMEFNEARELFQNLATQDFRESDRSDELLGLLEYLPLAIQQASSYISRTQTPISRYIEMLRTDSATMLQVFEATSAPASISNTLPSESLFKTWNISFRQIQQRNKSAADILQVMSFFHHANIPETLLKSQGTSIFSITTALAFDEAMAELFSYGFISRVSNGYRLHPLVSLLTNHWLTCSGVDYSKGISQIALSLITAAFAENATTLFLIHPDKFRTIPTLLPHSQAILQPRDWIDLVVFSSLTNEKMKLQYEVAKAQMQAGQLNLAETLMESYRDYYLLDPVPSTGLVQASLGCGMVKKELGRYREAIRFYNCALDENAKLDEPNGWLRRQILINKANTFREQGQYMNAEQIYDEILRLPFSSDTLDKELEVYLLGCQANMLVVQGKLFEAEKKFQLALDDQEGLSANNQTKLLLLADMASMQEKMGEHNKAIDNYTKVIDETSRTLGENHMKTLTLKSSRACVYMEIDRCNEALKDFKSIHTQQLAVLGQSHPNTTLTQHRIGVVLSRQKKFKDALAKFDDVIELQKREALRTHQDLPLNLCYSIYSRADVLKEQREFDKALQGYKEANDLAQVIFGQPNPFIYSLKLAKAEVLIEKNDYDGAEKLLKETLNGVRNEYREDNPVTQDAQVMFDSLTRNKTKVGTKWIKYLRDLSSRIRNRIYLRSNSGYRSLSGQEDSFELQE